MAIEASPKLPDRKYLVQSTGDTKRLVDRISLFDDTQVRPVSEQYPDYVHPVKTAQARLNDLVYDLKLGNWAETEAEFWERNYRESARAQEIWEQFGVA